MPPSTSSRRCLGSCGWILLVMTSWLVSQSTGFCQPCQARPSRYIAAPTPLLPLYRRTPSQISTTQLTSATSSSSSSSSSEDGSSSAATSTTNEPVTGWKRNLLQVSNWASLLCVLDCTALPLVTVVLPLLGWVTATAAQMEFLHWLGHQIALFFVLPVGGSATLLNYLYAHQQKRIALLGSTGLVLVALANAPHSIVHLVEGSSSLLYSVLHGVHHGLAHRVTNLVGCACLLGSNYWSQRTGKCLHGHDHHGNDCGDHNHDHQH